MPRIGVSALCHERQVSSVKSKAQVSLRDIRMVSLCLTCSPVNANVPVVKDPYRSPVPDALNCVRTIRTGSFPTPHRHCLQVIINTRKTRKYHTVKEEKHGEGAQEALSSLILENSCVPLQLKLHQARRTGKSLSTEQYAGNSNVVCKPDNPPTSTPCTRAKHAKAPVLEADSNTIRVRVRVFRDEQRTSPERNRMVSFRGRTRAERRYLQGLFRPLGFRSIEDRGCFFFLFCFFVSVKKFSSCVLLDRNNWKAEIQNSPGEDMAVI
ncbi:hypothetical protein H6P81_019202 [Aristolochia fimbriata]|uniref:Uncharacterized protein n=1 Tax=Aristolochia fimbriata TaxID=158543 RepID=A0AAV7DU80_ARIFI|nr:hypothetical protein H6P81_019202 [Aristolochia fimbriata]